MSNELIKPEISQVPAHLQNADSGLGDVTAFIRPPRLKIVQPQSKSDLTDLFDRGDTIIRPVNELIAQVKKNEKGKPGDEGDSFIFIPLFFYPEWLEIWDITAGEKNMIIRRTLNEKDELVALCRDPNQRKVEIDGKPAKRIEVLTFVGLLPEVDKINDTPVTMHFSGGSWIEGSNFLQLIKMRKAPLYGCRFEVKAYLKSNDEGEWYAFLPSNPLDGNGWLDAETCEITKKMHLELKKFHSDGLLMSDAVEEEPTENATSDDF